MSYLSADRRKEIYKNKIENIQGDGHQTTRSLCSKLNLLNDLAWSIEKTFYHTANDVYVNEDGNGEKWQELEMYETKCRQIYDMLAVHGYILNDKKVLVLGYIFHTKGLYKANIINHNAESFETGKNCFENEIQYLNQFNTVDNMLRQEVRNRLFFAHGDIAQLFDNHEKELEEALNHYAIAFDLKGNIPTCSKHNVDGIEKNWRELWRKLHPDENHPLDGIQIQQPPLPPQLPQQQPQQEPQQLYFNVVHLGNWLHDGGSSNSNSSSSTTTTTTTTTTNTRQTAQEVQQVPQAHNTTQTAQEVQQVPQAQPECYEHKYQFSPCAPYYAVCVRCKTYILLQQNL
jgi:hypothetical protein